MYFLSKVKLLLLFFVFFFKQKTAYEMRISDWSSDVCSSDLPASVALRLAGSASLAERSAASRVRNCSSSRPISTAATPVRDRPRLLLAHWRGGVRGNRRDRVWPAPTHLADRRSMRPRRTAMHTEMPHAVHSRGSATSRTLAAKAAPPVMPTLTGPP